MINKNTLNKTNTHTHTEVFNKYFTHFHVCPMSIFFKIRELLQIGEQLFGEVLWEGLELGAHGFG